MKKIIIVIIILGFLLVPFKFKLKDGGSVSYKSFSYEYVLVHTINNTCDSGFEEGKRFSLFSIEIFNNVTCNVTVSAKGE